MSIQFRRGTSTKRASATEVLKAGQPFYETDTGKLYIGTGGALKDTSVITSERANDTFTVDQQTSNLNPYNATLSYDSLKFYAGEGGYAVMLEQIQDECILSGGGGVGGNYSKLKLGYNSSISFTQTSGNVIQVPDKAGTIALLSDISELANVPTFDYDSTNKTLTITNVTVS